LRLRVDAESPDDQGKVRIRLRLGLQLRNSGDPVGRPGVPALAGLCQPGQPAGDVLVGDLNDL
jgi:hypothetical protein